MRKSFANLLVSIVVVLILVPLSGCPGSKSEKCSWGEVCPPGQVCHEPNEQCVLPDQISSCRDEDEYESCNYPGSPPHAQCRNGICIVPVCGDSIIDPEEQCDGENLGGATCESLGLGEGTLGCKADCTFDTSSCELGSMCGNNIMEGDEVCDGDDLDGQTCQTQGFYGGTLACSDDCMEFDTSRCGGYCGDGTINGPEVCDGLSLGGETCESQGLYEGTLVCLEDCTGFDTSGCGGYCGDGEINGDEVCDGEDFGGETCESFGFNAGDLACGENCASFDTSGCYIDPLLVTWISISGGTFDMGSNDGYSYEQPVHSVTVPTFEMTETQVTVEQYGECVTAGVCTVPSTYNHRCNWDDPDYEDHPVNCIDWHQAKEFCEWAGGRLPSEAEWEYAARSGGQDIIYPWGNDDATCDYAVMYDVQEGCGNDRTWSVCSKTAGNTDQGLCDMAGNVWEWLEDDWHWDYNGAPDDGSAWVDEPRGSSRVLRGGSFSYVADYLRAANRGEYGPSVVYYGSGVRCARVAP